MSAKIDEIPSPPWLDRTLFPFRHHRIALAGHHIHYIDEGPPQAPPLLLLHGNGSWSYGFRHAIPSLARHYRVLAPDYPGFGLSTAAPDFSFKPEDHSRVVEAFVDALDLRAIRLFVEDWGGPIGLGLGGRRPERVHALIISNTWAWPAQGSPNLERFSTLAGGWLGRFLITRWNFLAWIAVPNLTIARRMTAAERRGYYMPYPTPESRLPQAIFPREILASREYLRQVELGLDELVDKPVLIVWGGGDPGFGEGEKKRFLRIFESATLLELPNAKHFVLVDEPERSVEAIVAFEKLDTHAQ